jgi:hypothetical protein
MLASERPISILLLAQEQNREGQEQPGEAGKGSHVEQKFAKTKALTGRRR